MNLDLLDQLKDAAVPEVPSDIDERLHHRLNASLTLNHFVDFVCQALPYALAEFARPFGSLIETTFGSKPKPRPRGE